MPSWRYKINIKQYLGEGEDREAIQAAYDGIKKELSTLPPGLNQRIPHQFHDYTKMALDNENVEVFNLGMQYLYDWADQERIWMGAL